METRRKGALKQAPKQDCVACATQSCLYQTPYPLTGLTQARRVMEVRCWGTFISPFQASQQASTMMPVAVPNTTAEEVGAQVGPALFHWVQFRRVRQRRQASSPPRCQAGARRPRRSSTRATPRRTGRPKCSGGRATHAAGCRAAPRSGPALRGQPTFTAPLGGGGNHVRDGLARHRHAA